MKLSHPFKISPRLMPGLLIGGAWIQIEKLPRESDGRNRYHYIIDLPNGRSFEASDLRSGCQGGTLQEGFCSLLAFLDACLEAQRYPRSENRNIFPRKVIRWLESGMVESELGAIRCELEDSANHLIEE